MARKRRTREHVIAELSANHVERHILRCGFSTERIVHDYGIDLVLFTYGPDGEIENGQVFLQLKATDRPRILSDRSALGVTVSKSDLELWLMEPMPVILVLYDARRDAAYWLYVQAYFENLAGFELQRAGATVTVQMPLENSVDESAVRRFARYRDDVLAQIEGVIRHRA